MRLFTPLLFLLICIVSKLSAEGTREMAPNGSIVVNGNSTTDLAALHINHTDYNNFASYFNNDPHSRLNIHVKDPSTECIFLGFSFGHLNVTSPNPTRTNFEYRVKDPAGNIVFGPVTVLSNAANIQNWSQAFNGPMQINGAAGYDAHQVTSADLASQGWSGAGDYYVEFRSTAGDDFLIDFWDITVADCSGPTPTGKTGRIWSYNWSIFAVNDFGFPNRPFNGAFYVCAPDPEDEEKAFITKIDFNNSGFRPAAFNIAFNHFGSMNSGNVSEDRKSVQFINSTQSEYAIFLNDPVELCETAIVGEIALHGISRCDAENYCIKFTTSKEGQVELLLDFDGPDDIFTPGTRDVLITYNVDADEVGVATCIFWDGLDGLGNPLPEVDGYEIPIIISYAQGIYHFPIYDAELMTNGVMLEAVRPGGSIPLLYYDDSNISVPSESGEPAVQLSGCDVPCHRWTRFIDNTIAGFGNLNTINSWWFSQRIVRQDVLVLPGYYTCEVDGPAAICPGGTTQIVLNPQIHPANVLNPQIVSTTWEGPGIIGTNTGNTITIGSAGNYSVEMAWLTGLGDTCFSSCDYELSLLPVSTETIDTLIVYGNVLVINGETYSEPGQYVQNLTNSEGCDSVLTINVKVLQTILHYDLDACYSFMSDGSHMDYSEFTVDYPQPLSCADITAGIVFRSPPEMQKHSCTPGVNNSVAMCISSLDTCDYDPGNDASLIFEVTIIPDADTAIHLTGLSFFEQAPLIFNWIQGDTGPNNFPTLYGLRILKNGTEIYRREGIPTSPDWSEQSYNFLDEDAFIIEEAATFRFELLPYCLTGNGAEVAAWDIDEISVTASCAPFEGLEQVISGIIKTPAGLPVNEVKVALSFAPSQDDIFTITNTSGEYSIEKILEGSQCEVTAARNDDYMNGVSTLDLVQIQKHLLGLKPFDSPYKFIAADANRSNTISVKDILDLRKLILGIYTELPRNTSWRFGTADEFLNGSYPWGFKESIHIENLKYDELNADFTAVKVGDITGDAETGFWDPEIISRNSSVFILQIQNTEIQKGIPVKIEFTAKDLYGITGMQFALDLEGLTFLDILDGSLDVNQDNFRIDENNRLRFSWNHFEPIEGSAGSVLFSLIVSPVQSGRIGEMLSINDKTINSEIYLGDVPEIMDIDIEMIQGKPNILDDQLFPTEPNPFSGNTELKFQLSSDGDVNFRFFDVSGRILKTINGHYDAGIHSLTVSKNELGISSGVVFCHFMSGKFVATQRILAVENTDY